MDAFEISLLYVGSAWHNWNTESQIQWLTFLSYDFFITTSSSVTKKENP